MNFTSGATDLKKDDREKTTEAYTCTVVSHEALGERKVSLGSRRIMSHSTGAGCVLGRVG